jgi:hypothetical protein
LTSNGSHISSTLIELTVPIFVPFGNTKVVGSQFKIRATVAAVLSVVHIVRATAKRLNWRQEMNE